MPCTKSMCDMQVSYLVHRVVLSSWDKEEHELFYLPLLLGWCGQMEYVLDCKQI